MARKGIVNSSLPRELFQTETFNSKTAENYIKRTLEQQLPPSDRTNLESELKWTYTLEKHSLEKRPKLNFKRKTVLNRKEKKRLGLLKLPTGGWDYEKLIPMRELWKLYMRKNLNAIKKAPNVEDSSWPNFSAVLAKSEFIGAEVTVVRSKTPSVVGISGIVVMETKTTFQVVDKDSRLKTLIKEQSVFELKLDEMKLTVFGKHIMARPSDRSVKKVKSNLLPDL